MPRRRASLLVLAAVLLAPVAARAGGMEVGDHGARAIARGGAFSVRADDLSAIAINPGALSRGSGLRLLLGDTATRSDVRFTRAVSGIPDTKGYNPTGADPNAPVENEIPWSFLNPMFVAAADAGDFDLALGLYAPSAPGAMRFPVSGGNRYLLTGIDLTAVYLTGTVAWGLPDRFGAGLSLQWAMAPRLEYRVVADGSPGGTLSPYYDADDVVSVLEHSDSFAFSAVAGAWVRLAPWLEVGLSGRVLPVVYETSGTFSLENVPGQTQFAPEQLEVTGSSARVELVLPPTARLGFRYLALDAAGDETFDVELDLVWEGWSMVERFDTKLDGQINLFAPSEVPDVVLEKRWRDTISARLGGTFRAIPGLLDVSAGGGWERGAVPPGYEHLEFVSFDRFQLGLGITATFGPAELTLAWMHVFQEDREVDESLAKVYQIRPLDPCPESCDGGKGWSGVPVNAGRFETGFDLVSAGVEVNF